MGGGKRGNFGNTYGSRKSVSVKNNRLYGKPGQKNRDGYKETFIGPNGRAIREVHYTDHGNPKHHTNPHEHSIMWDKNGNPIFERK
jgi:hypothetical protein